MMIEEYDAPLITTAISKYSAELAEYKNITSSIITKLGGLQNFTEETFLKIGDKLPDINRGLHEVESDADQLLDYFKKESGLLSSDQGETSSDLGKLNRALKYLIKIASDQGDAFLKMSEMMKRIENIKTSIESIRDFAAEMEMLSLNAAIVAIKAGDSGRTLNPITVELKKMANSAISLIDEIVNTSEELAGKYSLFQELSEEQAESCRTDVQQVSDDLGNKYTVLQQSILGLVGGLDMITTVTRESKQPIGGIMNTLQIQDILKQCTDHVRLSLEKSSNEVGLITNEAALAGIQPEQILDTVAFQEKVPALCAQLLDDIDSRLEESIEKLKSGFGILDGLLQGITSCTSQSDAGNSIDEVSINGIEESFKDVEGVVLKTATMIQNVAMSWNRLWSTAVGLETMLENLEKQFRQLKKLTNFHLINIPIKIEVARSTGLSKDGELSERVEGLAEYINTEMRQSHKEVIHDYQFLSQMVESMGKHKKEVENNLDSIAVDMDGLLSNFSRAKEHVKATYTRVYDHISELVRLIRTSLADLERINRLIERNKELKVDFEKLSGMIGEVKESIMSAVGSINWELHDGRLNEIVNKFTVLAHKKIAGDLYNVNVEHGGQEGEVVFF